MLNLFLAYRGGGYELVIPNEGTIALLTNAENEAAAVRTLASAMRVGVGEVVKDAEYIFENYAQITPEVIEGIFGSASQLMFVTEVIFTCEEGKTLLDVLQKVGEALSDFFPV